MKLTKLTKTVTIAVTCALALSAFTPVSAALKSANTPNGVASSKSENAAKGNGSSKAENAKNGAPKSENGKKAAGAQKPAPTKTNHAPKHHAGSHAANDSAQKLVDSLNKLGVDHVDYLYAYLQSITLKKKEYDKIVSNGKKVAGVLASAKGNQNNLSTGNKMQMLNLFLHSAQMAHVKIAFIDGKGENISLKNYDFKSGLLLQIKDLNGNLLATIKPTKADLSPTVLAEKIAALKDAVEAKHELEKTKKFVPMPNASLPNPTQDKPCSKGKKK